MAHRLVIVGGGQIGSAIASGLTDAHWCEPAELCLVEIDRARREVLVELHPGVLVTDAIGLDDVDEGTGAVLAVKPEAAEGAARLLGAVGVRRVLSIVAGLSTTRIEAVLTGQAAVVRAMPNTPVLVRKGVAAIAGGSHATSADLDWAEDVLGALGAVVRLPERQLDVVTGLSGSMPAYLYLVVEALIEAGVLQGLTRATSSTLVIGTLEGAGALLAASGETPESLRAQVTSPGGTTAAGLRALESRAVRSAFLEAVASATERSRQLGR
ncbi:MAG TPA: pyrroline-5-carboxylate reductase [Acidimicrobiales bacterium]|jgi:pyrroline-5-carboxylate reductase|nr:pyrroline-5-carboxylate reductase [Acidimicrobiales bacterium]